MSTSDVNLGQQRPLQTRFGLLRSFQAVSDIRFRAVWFFLNLIVYGSCMAMVETFLFVYLEREFVPPADKTLLGLSVAVMCVFELPVFFYFERVLEVLSERTVLNLCHVVFALRCLLYVLLPRGNVWTVLLVEPLHGITFAAMWTASVHYAQNHAPRGINVLIGHHGMLTTPVPR